MQLGSILSGEQGVPTVGRPVKWRHVRRDQGRESLVLVEATLVVVPEPERRMSKKLAESALQAEYKDRPIPDDERKNEESIYFLLQALRNSEDIAVRFVANEDVPAFKSGLTTSVINYLMLEYWDYISEEFPECMLPEERKRLEEEAAKNSGAGQR